MESFYFLLIGLGCIVFALVFAIAIRIFFVPDEKPSVAAPPSKNHPDSRPIAGHLPPPTDESEGPIGFVPVEGGVTRNNPNTEGTLQPGHREFVVTGDWYPGNTMPSDFMGEQWPRGTIETDVFTVGDPKRPRRQDRTHQIVP